MKEVASVTQQSPIIGPRMCLNCVTEIGAKRLCLGNQALDIKENGLLLLGASHKSYWVAKNGNDVKNRQTEASAL